MRNYKDPRSINQLVLKEYIEFDDDPNNSMFEIKKKDSVFNSMERVSREDIHRSQDGKEYESMNYDELDPAKKKYIK